MISQFQWVRSLGVLCTGLIKWQQSTSSALVLMWSLRSSSNLIQLVGGIHFLADVGLGALFISLLVWGSLCSWRLPTALVM